MNNVGEGYEGGRKILNQSDNNILLTWLSERADRNQ